MTAPLLLIVAAYCALGYLVEAVAGLPGRMANVWFEGTYLVYPALVLCTLPLAVAAHRWHVRDAHGEWIPGPAGWNAAWNGPGTGFITSDRAVGAAMAAFVIPFFLNTYGSWKSMIPDLQPFVWDVRLTRLDRVLHFGRLPWEWLQPLLGRPVVTRTLDLLYILWLPINAGVIIWQGWSARRPLRDQFFLSYVLIYAVLGTAAAIAFAAAGPCYFAAVTTAPNPYAPLLAYLGQVNAEQPLIALGVQQTLWQNHAAQLNLPFVGISAMPSVHVAVAALFAFIAWRTSRWLGWIFSLYAAIILVGSVHLGWHYAVDGYASLLGASLIWWGAGAALRRRGHTPAT